MEQPVALARILLSRLERISADSRWAHQASGVRGALLRVMHEAAPTEAQDGTEINSLMDAGFAILQRAARERIR
jgi:hypothetical protein